MDEKAGVILRDLLLDSLETYKEEKENADFENEFYDLLGKSIKKAKEGFLDPSLMDSDYYHDSDTDTFEYFLAPVYAVELCSLIPEVTDRATMLSSSLTFRGIDSIAEKYLEEASRCYIYGFFLAAAIMCRGSIEYSLKKYLGITESGDGYKILPINHLLKEAVNRGGAFSLVDKELVSSIYGGASACVHGRRQINSDECLEYINNTKIIIGKLLR